MKLYLARHCKTNYNELSLCNYDPTVDVHLSPTGLAQAETLAEKLRETHFDHILVSEHKRTQQTADAINKFHNQEVGIDPRLNDHISGFEGRHFEELQKALDAADNRWAVRLNGGESIEDLKIRVAGFIDDLRTKDYDSVLIVTSQWPINVMLVILQNISYEEAWAREAEQGTYITLEI